MLANKKKFIIGNGFLAKKFKKYLNFLKKNQIVIYVAGISNSSEKNPIKLKREIKEIRKFCKIYREKLIYISTYSIIDNNRLKKQYVKNKIKIEKIIRKKIKRYVIIRLPEIVGKNNNPYTLTNFFYKNIKNDKTFLLYDKTKRNLLDVDDAIKNSIKLIKVSKKENQIINLLNKNFYTPRQIVGVFEKILKKKAKYKIKKIKNNRLLLKNSHFLKTKKDYLKKTIRKYY